MESERGATMSKYYNRPAEQDGYHFDSQAEARRYGELKLMEKAGEIIQLEVHPKYLLVEGFVHDDIRETAINYIADFSYYDRRDKKLVVEDVKSLMTRKLPVYRLKRKLFLSKYPHVLFMEIEA
jgi:hypothetical protein